MATLKENRKFSDIDLLFKSNPFTRDIYVKRDEEAVKTALKHLLLTKNYERPFHPEIGTQIHSLLFENFSSSVRLALEKTITETIEKFEPRIRIVNINIREIENNNDLELTLIFTFKNIELPITLTTLLSRVR